MSKTKVREVINVVEAVTVDDAKLCLKKIIPLLGDVRGFKIKSFRHDTFVKHRKYFYKVKETSGKIVQKELRKHDLKYSQSSCGFSDDVFEYINTKLYTNIAALMEKTVSTSWMCFCQLVYFGWFSI